MQELVHDIIAVGSYDRHKIQNNDKVVAVPH